MLRLHEMWRPPGCYWYRLLTATCFLQAAVHPEVLDELRNRFSIQQECFASPLNCRWPQFCSMFPDTDAPFGSCGDFFQFHPRSGAFEANPPFDKSFVSTMTAHMHKLLSQTDVRLQFRSLCTLLQRRNCCGTPRGTRRSFSCCVEYRNPSCSL